jgi:hypothetical protein
VAVLVEAAVLVEGILALMGVEVSLTQRTLALVVVPEQEVTEAAAAIFAEVPGSVRPGFTVAARLLGMLHRQVVPVLMAGAAVAEAVAVLLAASALLVAQTVLGLAEQEVALPLILAAAAAEPLSLAAVVRVEVAICVWSGGSRNG